MAAEASIVWNQGGEERIPRSFGRLWLLRRLARGGMGEVYLAATTGIEGAERPCVVKIIRRDHATDKSFVARFLDEARVQAQLQHHGVAQILEASTDASGEPYVVVEHVEGRSLGEVRTRATNTGVRIDWPDAVAIGTSAAEALGHIHERTDSTGKALDIVHRDLSPQNVMIGYGGDVKLIDFGTARAENRKCHTISGVVFAKPGYVAPEVAAGISGDFRVDLYALGIMLWELLAGRRFLQGDPSEHLAKVEKNERKPPPVAALVGAPLELDDIIAKLTAHHIVDRYASAKLAASELVKLLSKAPGLPNGERGVRARISNLMYRLFPSEPAKSRAEFGSLVKAARWAAAEEAKAQAAPSSERAPAPSASPAPSPSPEPKAEQAKGRVEEVLDGNVLAGTRYRILRTIGRGAMGVVYEAEHVDLQRRVALKVMSHEEASSKVAASFRREARAIARLCHPNLVMIHDFGEAAGGRAYCAMELLRGETLEQRFVREGRVPGRDAVALGILACRGLEAAHAVGVVHCDLKPANLFLSSTGPFEDAEILEGFAGGLKILDFGIAKTTQELHESPHGQGEFAVVGTPEYMAPEQAQSSDVDGRADVYALGCVLYELCTGRLPFVASSAATMSELKSKSMPEPMTASRALRIPARLDRVVMKALAPRPEERYASATEFRRALEGVFAIPGRRRTASRWIGYACIASASLFALGVFATPRRLAGLPPTASTASPLSIATTTAPPPALAATPTSTAAPLPTTTAIAKPNPTAVVIATPSKTVTATTTAKPSPLAAASIARPSHLHPSNLDKKPAELVSTALAAGNIALQSGSLGDALAIHRALAKQHPDDASVQRAWAESAAAARSWTEAIEASEAWAFADSSVEPRLYLARMLAYSGRRRAAVRILENVLEAHPEADEARALLRDYRGDDAPPPVSSAQAVRTPSETP